MHVTMDATPVPLRDDGGGGLRVGRSRVSFESVWRLHQQGAGPAEIVEAFDTLDAADVYAVLAWALRHLEDVKAYITRRQEEADEMRRDLETAGVSPTPDESAQL